MFWKIAFNMSETSLLQGDRTKDTELEDDNNID